MFKMFFEGLNEIHAFTVFKNHVKIFIKGKKKASTFKEL